MMGPFQIAISVARLTARAIRTVSSQTYKQITNFYLTVAILYEHFSITFRLYFRFDKKRNY